MNKKSLKQRQCGVEGCDRIYSCKGFCSKHYDRWWKYGDPNFTKYEVDHKMKNTRIYRIWRCMKARCNNPNTKGYPYYGARGIKVCKEWHKFTAFYRDMEDGYEDHLTIDRIDNYKGYYKENCRWATYKQQANNKRPRTK